VLAEQLGRFRPVNELDRLVLGEVVAGLAVSSLANRPTLDALLRRVSPGRRSRAQALTFCMDLPSLRPSDLRPAAWNSSVASTGSIARPQVDSGTAMPSASR
jgi:hypothetical protein